MRPAIGSLALGLVLLLLVGTAQAQRRLPPYADAAVLARYAAGRPVSLSGFIERVDWSGSTTWITLRSETEDKAVWRVEAASPAVLRAAGFGPLLVRGARISLSGRSLRDPELRAGVEYMGAYPPDPDMLAGHTGPLTDKLIARYAAAPWTKGYWSQRRVVLGRHNGVELIADHPCGDICPNYTVRVIHYALPVGPECERIGGASQRITIVQGVGRLQNTYCVPKVLVDRGLQGDRDPER